MSDVVIIILVSISFIGVLGLFLYGRLKKLPKKEEKKEEKKDDKKEDDIPAILKEVTQGNYMAENLQVSDEQILMDNMVENEKIHKPKYRAVVEDNEEFHPIEIEDDDEPLNTDDILNQMDSSMSDETVVGGQEKESMNKQVRKLSREMKALLIANILNKKDDV